MSAHVQNGNARQPRLGIFARTFVRTTPTAVARAVASAGYRLAHWNFAAVRLPTLADDISDADVDGTAAAFRAADVSIVSVSATFNAVHPDAAHRTRMTTLAADHIRRVPRLGADVATLCTGTRDVTDMWRGHPDNIHPSAWRDLRETLDPLLEAAAAAGVTLGIEPEPGNVVRDAAAAARLLGELGTDAPIGIVLDPANLLTPATVDRQSELVATALDLLGPRVVGVQLKDVGSNGATAAGCGLLDYPALMEQLAVVSAVPWIVQDVDEDEAARVRADLERMAAPSADGSAR